MAGPEGWFTPEIMEKYGFPGGFIVGGFLLTAVWFRIIKSGALVFGDKAKILVEREVLAIKLEHALKEIEERDVLIAALKNGNGGR